MLDEAWKDCIQDNAASWQRMQDQLDAKGYQRGAPSAESNYDDRQICNQAQCRECGYYGLYYHPFTKPDVSYRAFAVCPQCGEWHEF